MNDNYDEIDSRLDAISQKEAAQQTQQTANSPHHPGAADRARQWEQNLEQVKQDASDEITVDATASGGLEPNRDRASWVDFPLEALPLITRNYVTAAARAINADPACVAVATLNTAGAAIGARLKLRLGGYDWTAAPILWTALIGASSLGKSPAMKAPLKLLDDKERELAQAHASAMKDYNREYSLHKKVLSKIDKYNDKAIDKEEEGDEEGAEALRQKAANLERSPHFKPPQKPAERVLTISGDFTLQGLIGFAADNPMGYQLYLDELTQLFASLSNSSDGGAAQEFLKFYDGTPSRTGYKNEDKNRRASQCWASILGGGVPSTLQGYLKGTQYERDGLLSRFCLVWAPPIPPDQYDPEAEMTEQQTAAMKAVLETLVNFQPDFIETTEDGGEKVKIPKSRFCRLSTPAQREFSKKRADLYKSKFYSNQDAQISLLGKSDGLLGRVALILHTLEQTERYTTDETQRDLQYKFGLEQTVAAREVSFDTYKRAEQITDWLLHETETVYKKLGILADDTDLSFILDRLKKYPDGVNASTIQHWKSRWRDRAGKVQVERLLEIGVKRGLWTATVSTEANNKTYTLYRAVKK